MIKQCAKCKATFGCQNETRGCWCESVQLSQDTLQYLREKYANCLCPECLQALDERYTVARPQNKQHNGIG